MQRRTLLRGVGIVLLGGLAGCAESDSRPARAPPEAPADGGGNETISDIPASWFETNTPAQPFTTADFAFSEGEDGSLVVTVTVRNRSEEAATGEMTVTSIVAGESVSGSTTVELGPTETGEFDVTMPASYEAFTENRNIQSIRFD